MKENSSQNIPIVSQVWHFIIHLRWHYQVFILSGGYLLGGLLSLGIDWSTFMWQFLNVHLLLFGGATAYNSYWDKDEGPVGGLQNPPPMQRWMWPASLLWQFFGLVIALWVGFLYSTIYALSIFFFWLYSTPHFRWKGKPLRSLVAIGISTGCNSVLMGFLAAGNAWLAPVILTAASGVTLMVLSLYPVSQIYQFDEDQKRGDQTFSMKFGFPGVIRFFGATFAGGIVLVSVAISDLHSWLGFGFLLVGLATGSWVYFQLKEMTVEQEDYHRVMRIKYRTSLAFVLMLIILLSMKYIEPAIFWLD